MEMDADTALAFMETEINSDPLREQAMRAIKKEIERLRAIEKLVAESSPTAGDLYGGTYCVFCEEYNIYEDQHGPNCAYRLAGGK